MMDDPLFYEEADLESILQLPAMRQGVQSIQAMNAPMEMFRLLWAYDVSVERAPSGEIALVGGPPVLPAIVDHMIDRWDERMVVAYQLVERIRDQRDYFAIDDVPDAWWEGTRPDLVYPGLCFAKVWEWQALHAVEGATWVKAFIELPAVWVSAPISVRFGQSWLELPGGITYNGTCQRFYRTDEWRKITSPIDETRSVLSRDLARRLLPHTREYFRRWADNYPSVRNELNELLEDGTAGTAKVGERDLGDTLRWLIPDAA